MRVAALRLGEGEGGRWGEYWPEVKDAVVLTLLLLKLYFWSIFNKVA